MNPVVDLNSEYSILTAHPGMMLNIPCKPTSPNVTIEIKFNTIEYVSLG